MTKVILFLLIFIALSAHTQKALDISLEGYMNNFSSKERISGGTMYMFQNGRMVSKSVSNSKGFYFISGSIKTKLPFELMISKPGFMSKKVLLDFQNLKIQNPNGTLQAMEELVIELFEIRDGVDLSFVKGQYAEKFNWDESRNIAVPEEKYKKDIEDAVVAAYSASEQGSKAEIFKRKLSFSIKNKDFSAAILNIDSILVYEPENTLLKTKKEELIKLTEKIQSDLEDRQKFNEFKKSGDDAFAKNDLQVAAENYENALKIIDDNRIKFRLAKIQEMQKRDEQKSIDNTKSLSLRKSSDSLRSVKEFKQSIAKLKEIQILDPAQRIKLQTEIKEITKESQDFRYSESIEKYIGQAQNQNETDSLDEGLSNYHKAEMLIKKLSSQQLVNNYTSQIQDGIASISRKKNSKQDAYKKQIQKAFNNVLKGPDFYELANRILDSEPMKTRAKDPKVISLKKQIKELEDMYVLKKSSFDKLSTNKPEALSDLKKAYQIGNSNYRIVPKQDLAQMKDSLSSWSGGADFIATTQAPIKPTDRSGSVVRSPGELHAGSDFDALNDLSQTIRNRKSDPLKDLQDIRDEIDYELFFTKTIEEGRNEAASEQMTIYMNQLALNKKETINKQLVLQNNQAEAKQILEAQIKEKETNSRMQQELSLVQIEEWKTDRTYQQNIELLTRDQRNQSFSEKQNDLDNEREIISRQNNSDNTERIEENQRAMLRLGYAQQQKDSLEKISAEARMQNLESLKNFKPDFSRQANYLKDENGILFPSNEMTQRVFKRTNSQGAVTSVTIQRVVVDPNGYGVVYEQTTNENGKAAYRRNNASVTENVWFNESTGTDVIQD